MKDTIYLIGAIIPALIITWYSSNMIDEHYEERQQLQEQLWECQDSGTGTFRTNVTVTMYNAVEEQCDSTPDELADGTIIDVSKASEYKYVALSRNLLSRWGGPFNYDDYIVIEGTKNQDGIYKVKDTMSPRFNNRVDILKTEGLSKDTL